MYYLLLIFEVFASLVLCVINYFDDENISNILKVLGMGSSSVIYWIIIVIDAISLIVGWILVLKGRKIKKDNKKNKTKSRRMKKIGYNYVIFDGICLLSLIISYVIYG